MLLSVFVDFTVVNMYFDCCDHSFSENDDISIVVVGNNTSVQNISFEQLSQLVYAATDMFSIERIYKLINITNGYDMLQEFIESCDGNPIIIVGFLGSQDMINLITYVESNNKNEFFFLSTGSSTKDPVLMKKNVMRIAHLDDERSIKSYIQIFDKTIADKHVMIVDEHDTWARNVADLMENHYGNELIRLPLEKNITLPPGTLNVFVVSLVCYPLIFDILIPRKEDVVKITFADGPSSEPIPSKEYQDLLIKWNATIVVSNVFVNNPQIVEALEKKFDFPVASTAITMGLMAIQIAFYLKTNVSPFKDYGNQYFIANLEFGKESLNSVVRVFFNMGHTEMDGRLGEILDVIVVL